MILLRSPLDVGRKLNLIDPRRKRRIEVEAEIFVKQSDTRLFRATLSNLSVSGFKMTSWTCLNKEQSVFIQLPGIRVLRADIMWSDYRDFGCKFSNALHPVTLDHLVTSLREFE